MVEKETVEMVKKALASGKSVDELRSDLVESGYSRAEIDEILMAAKPQGATVVSAVNAVPAYSAPVKKDSKKIVIFAVAAIVVILLVYFFFIKVDYKDCGVSSKDGDAAFVCFEAEYVKCSPAKVIGSSSYDSGKIELKVNSGTPSNCEVRMTFTNFTGTAVLMNDQYISCDLNTVGGMKNISNAIEKAFESNKCTSSSPDLMYYWLGSYTSKPARPSVDQTAMSVTECNGTHVLVRNVGGTTLNKDADIYSSSGELVGFIELKSRPLISGNVSYVPINSDSPLERGVYRVIDSDYPEYSFTCK